MDVTPEMIDCYIADQMPWMDNTDRLRMHQGIAVYTHLQSPASDDYFFVGCSKEISTEKYVKFCNYLQKALDVLNETED